MKHATSALPDSEERKPTVLVVDDEALIRLVLSDYLQECGFKVHEASNADEAIFILEKSDCTIDLVFTDVRMPGSMDGFGLAKWIRSYRKGLPVIVTSGDAKKSQMASELCEKDSFMMKPYDLNDAVSKIRSEIEA